MTNGLSMNTLSTLFKDFKVLTQDFESLLDLSKKGFATQPSGNLFDNYKQPTNQTDSYTSSGATQPTSTGSSYTSSGTTPPASSTAPITSTSPSSTTAGSSTNSKDTQQASIDGGGPDSTVLTDNTGKAMQVAYFENSGQGMNPNLGKPNAVFTLQPGETLDVAMPDSWQGRVQKWDGNTSDPATWAEVNFQSASGSTPHQTWYDESVIQGYNGAMTISAGDGTESCGSSKDLIDGAPSDIVTTDAAGNQVIDQTQSYSNGGATNQAAADYYDSALGNSNAYVLPNDNNAVRTTAQRSLDINFDS